MDAFAMGDYGSYVWSSFALTFTVVIIAAIQARRRQSRVMHDLKVRQSVMETSE